MSEDRRKRQQDRQESGSRQEKKFLLYGIILLLVAGAFLGGRYYRNHKYDSFAQCLATKNARMYGLYWCSHCADQKAMFGAAFSHVPYVECAVKDSPGVLSPECKAAGAKLFPSWQFGTDPPKEGVLTLQELSTKTGCSLP
jgi:hypothetical protein